jgi:hypothetical protein
VAVIGACIKRASASYAICQCLIGAPPPLPWQSSEAASSEEEEAALDEAAWRRVVVRRDGSINVTANLEPLNMKQRVRTWFCILSPLD